MHLPKNVAPDVAAMPPVLRALLEAELAAGNEIAEVGHSFPAPPAGAYFRLTKPLQTHVSASDRDIDYYNRNGSNYSGEITDAKRFFFLLEPPRPPAPLPDMDALRAARASATGADEDANILEFPSDYTVEVDYRGEMLTYCEPTRSAHVICTFGEDPQLVPRTLSSWFYPTGPRVEKMRPEEKEKILSRIADYCRKHHGMTNFTFET
jgi:hypothetical protein